MEDEAQLLALARKVLTGKGYKVLTASDGIEALEIFRRQFQTIDLVVLDRTLPRLAGDQVLREMRTLRNDIKVLISSGDASAELSAFPGALSLLCKPYPPTRLCAAIRELLDKRE